jgi:PhoH-like ATPase
MSELELGEEQIGQLYAGESVDLDAAAGLPCHTGLVLHSAGGSALGRVLPDKTVRLVRGDREAFGLRGRSAEQRIALDLLLDESIGIVSLGGRAGTGKSALALCAGLEAVMERRRHRKVIVFRPLYAVGGQELGYLPGSESEKMSPWAQAVFDTLGAVVHENVMEDLRGLWGAAADPHPGRSLHDAFVIVMETQSLGGVLTVLSRINRGPGGAHPRRRPAGQPEGGPARRRDGGDRGTQGPSALRARHVEPLGAFADRGDGDGSVGGHSALTRQRAGSVGFVRILFVAKS